MFSGFMICHIGHTAMQNAAVWTPLILLCINESIQRRSGRFLILGALAVAFQVLAGHLQVVVLTTIPAMVLTWLPPHEHGPRAPAAARMRTFIAIFLIGFLLSALLLIPSFEYMRLSPRKDISYEEFTSYSFHPFLILFLFFPNALGTEISSLFGDRYWGPWNLPELGGGFCGIIPVALAAIALIVLRKSRSAVRTHAIMAVVAFALVLGKYNPLYRLMYYVPLYNLFRCPSRNWVSYNLALAVLAAFGLDAILGRCTGISPGAVRRATGLVITALLCILVVSSAFLALFPSFITTINIPSFRSILDYASPRFGQMLKGITLRSNAFLFPLLIMGAAAMLLHLVRSGYRAGAICMLLFALNWIDLMSFGGLHWAMNYHTERLFDTRYYPPPVQMLLSLGARSGEFRVCPYRPDLRSPGNSLAAIMNTFYGIPSSAGYGPLGISRYMELVGSDWVGCTTDQFVSNIPLFSMLNLRYLLCAEELGSRIESYREPGDRAPYRKIWEGDEQAIYENTDWLPRAWLVARARAVRSYAEARGILTDPSAGFNPREEALVQMENPLPPLAPSAGTVDRVRTLPNEITVAYRAPGPNILVLSEIHYPGWKARVDGIDAKILQVNGILRGVIAPGGAHEVEFRYRPRSFIAGLACSGATVAALLLWMLLGARSGPKHQREEKLVP
ncbi:MAG: hypothetical protein WCP22_05935 [Chlamydiota bacterium]